MVKRSPSWPIQYAGVMSDSRTGKQVEMYSTKNTAAIPSGKSRLPTFSFRWWLEIPFLWSYIVMSNKLSSVSTSLHSNTRGTPHLLSVTSQLHNSWRGWRWNGHFPMLLTHVTFSEISEKYNNTKLQSSCNTEKSLILLLCYPPTYLSNIRRQRRLGKLSACIYLYLLMHLLYQQLPSNCFKNKQNLLFRKYSLPQMSFSI